MKWMRTNQQRPNSFYIHLQMTLFSWILASTTCHAGEITEAFGYILGAHLSQADIITKRSGIGPHDIIPKKKAGTVKIVQAYTTPGENLIFSVDGKNYFGSMHDCSRMATAISYFLHKKFGDVIDKQERTAEDSQEKGTVFIDSDGGKTVSITCTDQTDTTVLSIRYTDIILAKKTLKNIEKEKNSHSPGSDGVRL